MWLRQYDHQPEVVWECQEVSLPSREEGRPGKQGELHGALDVEEVGEAAGEVVGAGGPTGMDGTAVRREKTKMNVRIV